MIILVDDEDRENEGDLMIAAEKITPEIVAFMARFGRGLVCLTMTEERRRQLDVPPMVSENKSRFGTAFCVSIEAREGVTTGISAYDRARTIQAAIADDARPDDLVRPGHIFPIVAKLGGVLVRAGQTEGSVDLCKLAGLKPAGVICEVMKDDGTMARMPDLVKFAEEHDLKNRHHRRPDQIPDEKRAADPPLRGDRPAHQGLGRMESGRLQHGC